MSRLLATMRLDARLQVRNGFYAATAFVLIVWVAAVSRLPSVDLGWFLPALVLGNLMMSTFYFVAGLVLLERAEGTIEAQVVTPLRPGEYLASKAATLTLLALAENLLLAGLLYGPRLGWIPLAAAIVLASGVYTLFGFLAIVRYDSINRFLMPSVLVTAFLSLPLAGYVAGWSFWPVYLHPLQGPLELARAGFETVPGGRLAYGVLASAAWLAVLARASLTAYDRRVVGWEGRP